MKLPAVGLAAAFASGVALGLYSPLQRYCSSVVMLRGAFLFALLLLLFSVGMLKADRLRLSASTSVCAWLLLGLLGSWIASQPKPQQHILNLVSTSRIDIGTPLRWHARLRDEPAELPWGVSYDLTLNSVEFAESTIPISGGLRLSYSPHSDSNLLPQLHAGDAISFVTQARLPQVYRDEGAFDRRAYLQQQGIDLTATLRAAALLQKEQSATFSPGNALARVRSQLRMELTELYPKAPDVAAVLRAMLLGDRSFVDRSESVNFQRTGVFHVLVVAGLHVGAFAVFLFWLGRRLRISIGWTTLFILLALAAYVAVIEQRPPVLRAALMALVVLAGGFFFRRLELLNSAAIAALILLVAKPIELRDSSFQLSFLAIGCIAGVAVPWIERALEPYARSLRGWRDVTHDASHAPRVIQFRIDLRSVAAWLTSRLPRRIAQFSGDTLVRSLGVLFRTWELLVLTLVLQVGMLPLMVRDFHRVTL